MTFIKAKGLRYVPLIFGFGLSTLILWGPLADPDLWWHLRLGEGIISGGAIPRQEVFSWTMHGRPFVDFYWFSEIIIAFLFRLLPPLLVSLLFAILGSFVFHFRLRHLGRFGWRTMLVVLAMAFAVMLAFGVRPLIFSWLFFVLLLEIVERIDELSIKKISLLTAVLFIPWANMHDGFVLPLCYVGLLLTLQCLFIIFQWLKQPFLPKPFLSSRNFKKLACLLGIALASTCINPYGLHLWQTLLHEGTSIQNKLFIGEWQPLVVRHPLGFIYIVTAVFVFSMAAYRKIWRPHQWIAYTLLFIMGTASAIHAPFFLLIILPTLAISLSSISVPPTLRLYAKIYTIPLAALGVILFFALHWYDTPKTLFLEGATFPYDAVKAVRQIKPQGNMFNEYGWGGYLDYHLPEYPVFIDGRMSSWKRGQNFLLEDHTTIEMLKPGFEKVHMQYNPDWFFLRPTAPLVQWLKTNQSYKVLYEDKVAIVIAKK